MSGRGYSPHVAIADHRLLAWWNEPRRHVAMLLTVLPLGVILLLDPDVPHQSPRLFVVLAAFALIEAWQLLFERARGRVLRLDAAGNLLNALVFCVLLAHDVPPWQALVSLSFGVVFGELVFGGRGYTFLHPVVVALAFQVFSFAPIPGALYWPLSTPGWLPLALGMATAALLAWWRRDTVVCWLGALAAGAIAVVAGWLSTPGFGELLLLAIVGLVLFADTAVVPSRTGGQLLLSILVVALLVLFGRGHIDGAALVYAVFCGQLCTPLIDALSTAIWQVRHPVLMPATPEDAP